jgi:hypothetical protein
VLLLACTSATVAPPGAGAGDEPRDTAESVLGGIDEPDEPEDTAPEEKEEDYGCSSVFDQDIFPTYEVYLAQDDWDALRSEWAMADGTKDYKPLDAFVYGDEAIEDAYIRLKGNSGCCWVGEKMQFVVSFVEEDEDARFHGLRRIAFDSPYYDPAVLRNRLSAYVFHKAGLPATCANNARLEVNGEYFGLYAAMEQMDHEYLERNFGDDAADGNLYKYGYELANNEGADTSKMEAFWSSYDPASFTDYGDPRQWVAEWAGEVVISDGDGYWCCGHNYYLYDHPDNGLMYLAWDMDGTFDWIPTGTSPYWTYGYGYAPHLEALLADSSYAGLFAQDIRAHLEAAYDPDDLVATFDAWVEQTYEAGLEDPYRYYDDTAYVMQLDTLRAYFPARWQYLDDWLTSGGY